jgi:hypothetical protein
MCPRKFGSSSMTSCIAIEEFTSPSEISVIEGTDNGLEGSSSCARLTSAIARQFAPIEGDKGYTSDVPLIPGFSLSRARIFLQLAPIARLP